MLKAFRLTSVLLASLALPALAQTPSPQPTASPRTGAPPAATHPSPAPAPAAAARPTTGTGKIDVNAASEQELATLPGIGPALAKQVAAGRPWEDLNDLVRKKALPQGVFDRNKDRFALANINTSSASDMVKTLPGIGDARSKAIVNGRPYASPQELVAKKVLTQGQFDKIRELIAY